MPRPKKKEHDADAILMTTVEQAVSLYKDGLSLARIAEEIGSSGAGAPLFRLN